MLGWGTAINQASLLVAVFIFAALTGRPSTHTTYVGQQPAFTKAASQSPDQHIPVNAPLYLTPARRLGWNVQFCLCLARLFSAQPPSFGKPTVRLVGASTAFKLSFLLCTRHPPFLTKDYPPGVTSFPLHLAALIPIFLCILYPEGGLFPFIERSQSTSPSHAPARADAKLREILTAQAWIDNTSQHPQLQHPRTRKQYQWTACRREL